MAKPLNKPIIVFGTGRSGTTLVSNILFTHNKIAFPSQYQEYFPRFNYANNLRRIFDNNFAKAIIESIAGKQSLKKIQFHPVEAYKMWNFLSGNEIDFSRDFLLNTVASEEEKYFIRNYFSKLVKRQKRENLGFKITGPLRLQYLSSIFPDAYFIQVTRDPIATIHSFLKVDFWEDHGKNKLWWKGAYSDNEIEWADLNKDNPVLITAFQIKKLIDTANWELESNPINYLKIDYASFINQPKEKIKEILDFTGLDHDQSCYSYLDNLQIRNVTKSNHDYFNESEIDMINSVFSSESVRIN